MFTLFAVKMIQIWTFPAAPSTERVPSLAEWVAYLRYSINLRLFNWRVPALLNIWRKNWFLRCALSYLVSAKFSFQDALENITQNLISKMHLKILHKFLMCEWNMTQNLVFWWAWKYDAKFGFWHAPENMAPNLVSKMHLKIGQKIWFLRCTWGGDCHNMISTKYHQ